MTYQDAITSTKVTLVEFFASWCPHCQRMMPVVADIKNRLEGRVPVAQFDIDENTQLSDSERVETIPTFIIYKNGKEVWRQSGEMDEADLLRQVESRL